MPVQKDATEDVSLQAMLQAYCKQNLYLLNRIDRPVSGLVVLTKSPSAHAALVQQQEQGMFRKLYLAIVETKEIEPNGILQDRLEKDGKFKKSRISEGAAAKSCSLSYNLLIRLERYLVLQVEISTGRFHQIRAQLAHAGMPVRADVKYGARRGNADRSIGLHAWKYHFQHPSTGEKLQFTAPIPTHDLWPIVQQKLNEHV